MQGSFSLFPIALYCSAGWQTFLFNQVSCFQVIFEFMSGIEESLANKLKAVGTIVKGDILPDSQPLDSCDESWNSESSDDESLHTNR